MKHLLMDPAFPDLIEILVETDDYDCANDNQDDEPIHELSDPLLTILARMEIAATRLW